jgi:hypothetical protein
VYSRGVLLCADNFNTAKTFDELLANNDLELFDLVADPDEMNNLAAKPQDNKVLSCE